MRGTQPIMRAVLLSFFLFCSIVHICAQPAAKTTTVGGARSAKPVEKAESQTPFYKRLSECVGCSLTDGWDYILQELRTNSAEYQRKDCRLGAMMLFSNQILYIAEYSSQNRKETGGWAGELAKVSFLVAISDMKNHHWPNDSVDLSDNEAIKKDIKVSKPGIDLATLGVFADVIVLGREHFKRHLEPAFDCFFNENLQLLARTRPVRQRFDAMDTFLLRTETEHELFLANAVVPGFNRLGQFWTDDWGACESNGDWSTLFSLMGKSTVLYATGIRRLSVEKVLIELSKTSQITPIEKMNLSLKHGIPG